MNKKQNLNIKFYLQCDIFLFTPLNIYFIQSYEAQSTMKYALILFSINKKQKQ